MIDEKILISDLNIWRDVALLGVLYHWAVANNSKEVLDGMTWDTTITYAGLAEKYKIMSETYWNFVRTMITGAIVFEVCNDIIEHLRTSNSYKQVTDLDLAPAFRTEANRWEARYFQAREELVKANKGIQRLRKGLDYINAKKSVGELDGAKID